MARSMGVIGGQSPADELEAGGETSVGDEVFVPQIASRRSLCFETTRSLGDEPFVGCGAKRGRGRY